MEIIQLEDTKIAVINEVKFKNKQKIPWNDVEEYLKQFIGDSYIVEKTKEEILIGRDLPDEYHASRYTQTLKGGIAKAKANAATVLQEMLLIADHCRFCDNFDVKHEKTAYHGWLRYDTYFALPVVDDKERYQYHNIFRGTLVVRLDQNGKKYLYDLINIKKEASKPLGQCVR